MLDHKKKQSKLDIYVLPFKTMEIMASYYYFIHMNVNQIKNPFVEILSSSFDLGLLKNE